MNLTNNYTPNVPQGNQQINNTQQPIENNFGDIAQLIAINHIGFNTANLFGTHNVVDFFAQSADPTTAASEIALYSKNVAGDANISELFYRYPNNGSVVQLTGSGAGTQSGSGSGGGQSTSLYSYTSSAYSGSIVSPAGYQYLANGIKLMWGIAPNITPTASGTHSATFSFPTGSNYPIFTNTPFHMEFNMAYPGTLASGATPVPYGSLYVTPSSATQFSITYVSTPSPVTNPSATAFFNFSFFWLAIGV